MTLAEFQNGLRILFSIDFDELVEAGVLGEDDEAEWLAFRANPHRWMITAADELADNLWALMGKRGVNEPRPENREKSHGQNVYRMGPGHRRL